MDLVRDKRVKDALMNSTIQNMFMRGELRKDHPLQRNPGRWSDSDRDGLIATVLKDEDIDSIKVCEQLTPNGVILWVIDGLQRLTTLNSYFNNGFRLGKNVEFPIVTYQSAKRDNEGNFIKDEYNNYQYELIEYDLRGKNYGDLPIELKEKFNNFKVDMVKHLDCTDEEIGYHIRRYNKQKSMNASENAVTFMDNIAKEVKRVSLNNRFFKNDAYKQVERNNGTIERIVTESIMCMFHLDKWQKQSRKMGGFLNQNSSREEFDKLNDNLNRIEKIYDDEFKDIFTAKNSFVWFTLFNKFTELNLPDRRFADFILEFKNGLSEKKINEETFSEIDRNKSTKDKSVIVKKINVLEQLMKEYLEDDISNSGLFNEVEFISENIGIKIDDVRTDMEFYKDILRDLENKTIQNGSKLLNKENQLSLLTLVAYSVKEEIELDDWIQGYAEKNNTYYKDQKKNYLHMKDELDRFIAEKDRKVG